MQCRRRRLRRKVESFFHSSRGKTCLNSITARARRARIVESERVHDADRADGQKDGLALASRRGSAHSLFRSVDGAWQKHGTALSCNRAPLAGTSLKPGTETMDTIQWQLPLRMLLPSSDT